MCIYIYIYSSIFKVVNIHKQPEVLEPLSRAQGLPAEGARGGTKPCLFRGGQAPGQQNSTCC